MEETSRSGSVDITSQCHPFASHDRNVPPTNRGGFTFKPLRTIKAHPSSPKYVHFDIFTVVEKGLHKSYTVSLTLAPLGPEQTWLAFITLRPQPSMDLARHRPLQYSWRPDKGNDSLHPVFEGNRKKNHPNQTA